MCWRTPWTKGKTPVKMEACEALVLGCWQIVFVNQVPLLANRSSVGVLTIGLPSIPMESPRSVSIVMSTTLYCGPFATSGGTSGRGVESRRKEGKAEPRARPPAKAKKSRRESLFNFFDPFNVSLMCKGKGDGEDGDDRFCNEPVARP